MEKCERVFECGHKFKKLCHQECGKCREVVYRDSLILPCGHMFSGERECWTFWNDTLSDVPCEIECGEKKPCGHICKILCKNLHLESSHDANRCFEKCLKILSCGHLCQKNCHFETECGECTFPCQNSCEHSKCEKKCSEICKPCIEPCSWHREHQGTCPSLCGAPCPRLPCNIRCEKKLSCGHQCMSVCGENCDGRLCLDCRPELGKQMVDYIRFETFLLYSVARYDTTSWR